MATIRDRDRYPADWDQIALAVKQEAEWCCEHCGKPCKRPDEDWPQFYQRMGWRPDSGKKRGRYVLTVSHQDQDPQNCDRANLKALCSVCHLNYDRSFRPTQRRLRAEWHGQLRIDDPEEAGLQLSLVPDRVSPYALPFQGNAPTEGKAISPPEQNGRLGEEDKRTSDKTGSGGDYRRRRRHTPKGSASGWIEQRQGNKGRKRPSASYYYRWEDEVGKHSLYIPISKLRRVRKLWRQRRSVVEILEVLGWAGS